MFLDLRIPAAALFILMGACVPEGVQRLEPPLRHLDAASEAGVEPDASDPADAGLFVPLDTGVILDVGPPDTGVPPAPPDAGFPPDVGSFPDTGPEIDPPPVTPLYQIQVRVHIGDSDLDPMELEEILAEMNRIWWFAGICFEFEGVQHDDTRRGGFDLWFVPQVPNPRGVNGVYRGDHDIWTRDRPSLRRVPGGTDILAARTAAHELGHALRLSHRQNNTNLMASGTRGWTLNDTEIATARGRARQVAVLRNTPNCASPTFE